MNRNLLATLALAVVFAGNVRAQAVHRFNSITDTYYGFPNMASLIVRGAYLASGTEKVDFGSVGPTGVRTEIMLSDKFGLGVDAFFSSTSVEFRRFDDADSVYYTDKVSYNRFQSLMTFSFHYGNSDKLDAYTTIAAGYASRKLKYETTDPDYVYDRIGLNIPVGFRISTGMRYMFTRFVGFNAAIGFGGPLLSAGITAKF